MPMRSKGARLWPRATRRDKSGRVTHPGVWIIRDGRHYFSTRCRIDDRAGAEKALAAYIATKHIDATQEGVRHPSRIPVADALALYARDIAPQHMRPHETAARIERLLSYFGDKTLAHVNGAACRAYIAQRSSVASARRELADLRAAINHHRREGLCAEIVAVAVPPRGPSRDRWITRSEAARLIWAAWRYREMQFGTGTARFPRRHVARFILLALYTGTRASAVCGAALQLTTGHGWIDLERGVFFRRAPGAKETKKRQPPIPLPDRLMAHLRRWKGRGQHFAVEWNGEPVRDVDKAFRSVARSVGLEDVTPHVLRHTAATWLMQAGTDLWEAAGYLGMTVEMLSQRYGHHHPNHLEGARTAFERHRQKVNDAAAIRRPTPLFKTVS